MNFNQLRYIIAVDKHRNFARAAEDCDIAQSTLSREIQRLEKQHDVVIFDRSRRPVVPTMKGVDLIAQAKILIEESEKFKNIAEKKDNRPFGDFRLGITPSLAPYILPLFAQKLSEAYPELNLKILEVGQKEMVDLFESDSLDGAISISPFLKSGFYEDPLFEEKFVLYICANHKLAAQPMVKWSDIPEDELILQEDIRTFFLNKDTDNGNFPIPITKLKNVTYENGSLETIRKIIDRNGGMTLLPDLACLYMGKRRLEMIRPIESPTLSRTIIFITPRGFEKKRIVKVIKQEILANLPKDS